MGSTQTPGVPLTLSGWAPNYFAIARTGSDSGTSSISRGESIRWALMKWRR